MRSLSLHRRSPRMTAGRSGAPQAFLASLRWRGCACQKAMSRAHGSLVLGLALCLLWSAGALALEAGDPNRGAEIYDRCIACHALGYNRTGPKHCGLLGRKAGGAAGFDYSEAMKSSGIVWDRASLDQFLDDPLASVPGTIMTYDGVKDPIERADLIAYLVAANRSSTDCP